MFPKVNPILVTVVISVLAAIVAFMSILFFGSDNFVEEQMEKIIQSESGVDLDLSPGSPETK